MDENRLIMLILIALFVIGVLSLVAIHFSLSGSADKEAGLLPSEIAEPQPYDSEEKEPAVPSVIETLADPVDAGKKPSPILQRKKAMSQLLSQVRLRALR